MVEFAPFVLAVDSSRCMGDMDLIVFGFVGSFGGKIDELED